LFLVGLTVAVAAVVHTERIGKGKVRSFTVEEWGGNGGTPFSSDTFTGQISQISLWGSYYLQGIQLTYSVSGVGPMHGNVVGTASVLNLAPGEYVTSVSGRDGSFIDQVTFTTNLGNSVTGGISTGGTPWSEGPTTDGNPPNDVLVTVNGNAGEDIDQLNLVWGLPYSTPFNFGPLPCMCSTKVAAYSVQDGTVGGQQYTGSLGLDFQVVSSIQVSALGAFDSGGDGLKTIKPVALYQLNSAPTPPQLLVRGIVPTGTGIPYGGGFRWLTLDSSVVLNPGTYTIVADGFGNGDANGNSGLTAFTGLMSAYTNLITYIGTGRFGTALQFPTTLDSGPANRYLAGSFLYEAANLH